jgi:glycosyltransferase involved in cell wall biosynthesis
MSRICQQASGLTAVSRTYLSWALSYAHRSREARDGVFPLAYPALPAETPSELRARAAQMLNEHRIPDDRILVTFVGIFGSTYDLETVIDAAHLLEQRAVPVHLVLAGDGEKAFSLRGRATRSGNITFTGWLDNLAVRALLTSSSIGLAPYTASAPQSMPNKPFEYMAAGLALISSLGGELRDLLEREKIGLSYRPGDAASLAEAIASLCEKSAQRAMMGAKGYRIFTEHFRGDVVYPKLARHLEAIAEGRSVAFALTERRREGRSG